MKPRIIAIIAVIIAAISILFALQKMPAPRVAPPSPETADESQLPIKEFMGHVMQRNAVQLWNWTAYEADSNGAGYDGPKTSEDWEDAESDALTLQQLTYALQHSRYRIDDPRWDQHVKALREATTASATAAEAKDFKALEAAGNAIDHQCVSCHLTFVPAIETPPPNPPGA